MSELIITFLGTSASVPTIKRNVAATAIQRAGDYFLFDCGEGTQRQMARYTGLKAPRAIFLTHYHPDHWLGLPGLLATLSMNEHDEEVTIFGPDDGIGKIRSICQRAGGQPPFAHFLPLLPGAGARFEGFDVTAYSTHHTPNSLGYIFAEDERPGKFDPALAVGIKPGPDYARLQAGEEVGGLTLEDVTGPPRRGRRIVLTGDSPPAQNTVPTGPKIDVLIHEATFSDKYADRAKKTRHSTGRQAGKVAARSNVDRLYLTHFSARENPGVIVNEAAQEFSPVEAARDGDRVKVAMAL